MLNRNWHQSFFVTMFSLGFIFCSVSGISKGEDQAAEPSKKTAIKTKKSLKMNIDTFLTEDATLRDIACSGLQQCWIVGDHNAVWHSLNKGETFNLINPKPAAHWRCIQVLNKQDIWLAGYCFDQDSLKPRCRVIHTNDGGKTWDEISGCEKYGIPIHLMVAGEEEFYLVTSSFGETPAAYLRYDGSQWNSIAELGKNSWRAAFFLTPELGILAGRNGEYIQIIGSQLHPEGMKLPGRNRINGFSMNSLGTMHMVTDHAGIMKSTNGGTSWSSMLEDPLADKHFHDIKTIACSGNKNIWCTGSPGTTILRSEDSGATWKPYTSGIRSTLNKLYFQDEKTGYAAGDFGIILRTVDGGLSWETIKGSGRKTALLCLSETTSKIPVALLMKKSREEGFRCTVHPVMQHDSSRLTQFKEEDLQLEITAIETGCNASSLNPDFILDQPEIESQGRLLFQRWGKLHDQRDKILLSRIISRIRQERPVAVMIPKPGEADTESATFLLNKLLAQAIREASNPNYNDPTLLEQELLPWQVKYIFESLPEGQAGKINVLPLVYLPRQKEFAGVLAQPLNKLIQSTNLTLQYQLGFDFKVASTSPSSSILPMNDILPNTSISPGSECRRNVPYEVADEQAMKLMERFKRVISTSDFAFDSDKSSRLLAELDSNIKSMNENQAALYLETVVENYLAAGQVDYALQMLLEIVKRYPESASARRATTRYFQLSSSAEIAYIRLKKQPESHQVQQVKHTENKESSLTEKEHELKIQELIKKNIPANVPKGPMRDLMEKKVHDAYFLEVEKNKKNSPEKVESQTVSTNTSRINTAQLKKWNNENLEFALKIKRLDPETFSLPEMRLPLASVLYKNQKEDLAHELLQKMSRDFSSDWQAAVQSEIWHYYPAGSPQHELLYLPKIATKPHLDGQRDEEQWTSALTIPISLNAPDELGDRKTTQKTSCHAYYDDKFLYFSADCEWINQAPAKLESARSRDYDFNLDGQERLCISIDTDRDYFTSYLMEIGHQGQTRESCAELFAWNPKWFVAHQMDETGWRVELAIPLEELTPETRLTGKTWNLQIARITPGQPLEALAHPVNLPLEMKNSALIKFK